MPGVVFGLILITIQVIDRVTQLGSVILLPERIVDQDDFPLLGSWYNRHLCIHVQHCLWSCASIGGEVKSVQCNSCVGKADYVRGAEIRLSEDLAIWLP